MQPTPEQMSDAANTVLFMVGAIVLVVAIGGGWLLAQWEKHAAYVERTRTVPAPKPIAINRQSDAVNRPQTDPVQAIKPRFEPTRFTKSELVRFLALAVIEEDDGSTHPLSQDAISRAAGISKVTAAAIMAEARGGEPETAEPYNPTKHLLLDGGERWIPR